MENLAAEWNKKCGNYPSQDYEKRKEQLLNQIERVLEEAKEVADAIKDREPTSNLLKELSDLKVVVDGLIFLSELPVEKAYEMVMKDNDRKWTEDFEEIVEILNTKYSEKTHEIVKSGCTNFYYSIHRRSDDKICKLYDHDKIDFSMIL